MHRVLLIVHTFQDSSDCHDYFIAEFRIADVYNPAALFPDSGVGQDLFLTLYRYIVLLSDTDKTVLY